jgi:membrane-bound lytic murein transglycosylase D
MEEPLSMNLLAVNHLLGLPTLRRGTALALLSCALSVSLTATVRAQTSEPSPPEAPASVPAEPVATGPAASAPEQDMPVADAPVDPINPDAKVNLNDRAAHQDLWQRIRSGFTVPDLSDDYVLKWEQYYGGKPDYMQRMMDRGGRYLFHIIEEVQRRGLPSELALLPFVESAFNPQAMSSARASGMWQFMPGTGRDFDLRQNVFRDDRRDVLASTRAALDYLTKLHRMFGDWHLALAAYNWGEGSVARAIKKNQADGLPTDYASLRMPNETRDYVPKLQAIKNIVFDPGRFAVALPTLDNHPYFLAVPIQRDIDVALAAKFAEMSVTDFRALNPQMNKPVILAAGTPQVLLPYDNAAIFMESVQRHRGAMASLTAWVAPRTMKTADAARQVGMSDDELRALNKIPPRMLVKAGSTLLVERSAHRQSDVSEAVADNASLALAPDIPPLKRVAFRVSKRGATVADVAKRYRVSPAQVADWNKVATNSKFAGGKTVFVWVPNKPGKVLAAKSTRGAKTTAATGKGRSATKVAAKSPAKKAAGKTKAVKVADARTGRTKVR